MKSGPKLSAIALVVVELVLCVLVYFGCLYIRRRRWVRDTHDESSVLTRPISNTEAVSMVFFPYSALKGLLIPNSVQCAACLKEFKDDDGDDKEEAETLHCVISKCGHVFHPTCVGARVVGSCPGCRAGPGQEREGEVVVQVEHEAAGEEGEEEEEGRCMIRLPEEVRQKITVQVKEDLPITGQLCSRTGYR